MPRQDGPRRRRLFAAASFGALAIAGCASGGVDRIAGQQSPSTVQGSDVGVASTSTPATTTPATTTPATTTPALLASTINGDQVNVSALVGQDALLWFWAPW